MQIEEKNTFSNRKCLFYTFWNNLQDLQNIDKVI